MFNLKTRRTCGLELIRQVKNSLAYETHTVFIDRSGVLGAQPLGEGGSGGWPRPAEARGKAFPRPHEVDLPSLRMIPKTLG